MTPARMVACLCGAHAQHAMAEPDALGPGAGLIYPPCVSARPAAPASEGTLASDEALAALREKAQSDRADMDSRFAYAEAAFAAGERDAAAEELLGMFEADAEWNEGAAKAKLLQIFEAVGLEDPWVVETRRRLSRLLFG